eukprot:3782537-Rhodomonas_salina.1
MVADGDTNTAKGKRTLHLWLFQPEAVILLFLSSLRWMGTAFGTCLYPISTGGKGREYWLGSEAGRLCLYNGSITLIASDGSSGLNNLESGYTVL